jgi:hypothetical protein
MKIAAVLAALAFAISCSPAEPTAAATAKQPAASPAAAPPAQAPSANQLAGPIAETFNSGGYTYVRIGNEWAAVPETKLEKGAQVAIDAQMTLENFESKSLNRTFDRIVFGSIAGAPAAHAAPMPPADTPEQHMQAPAIADVSVAPAPGGKTVQQVWQQKASLAGKEVVVRGKVVKSLSGIMGTNWIHLQDGTGSQATGDNDLTVTTDANVKTGQVVTIRGVLTVDKDFGMGYRYDVIVQKAQVTKESGQSGAI